MTAVQTPAPRALSIAIGGVVQGVGFRPFVYRIAQEHGVRGWVRNGADGVHIHAEGEEKALERFVVGLHTEPPPAAHIAGFAVESAACCGFVAFEIRESRGEAAPTARISPDLTLCAECRRELFDAADPRFGYPYINCTNCGPRYSIVLELPYDRARTTMRDWTLCEHCSREYHDPANRRFHAQPVACTRCGPAYRLRRSDDAERSGHRVERDKASANNGVTPGEHAIRGGGNDACNAAPILAVKGIGGYHLACDAANAATIALLRERKYRKERPFALMARDLETARTLIDLDPESEALLTSSARPIVLAAARKALENVAPDNIELGVLLPYTPLHELLFAAGAPTVLVMTSANRSSEPIAYCDDEAFASLAGIADAFLWGERPIARRVDDSIVRSGPFGATVLRRSRGLAPQAVARFPRSGPILALGADLKNAITLVVDGQAFASQHIGDLHHFAAREAFAATCADLCATYGVEAARTLVAHDAHPQYHTTEFATSLAARCVPVQHHRAHVASVLAEREAWDEPVVGFAFDGTGYGDDGTIWGGEVFTGSLRSGFERVAHLRYAPLPGGDAAARFPVQAAAGFSARLRRTTLRSRTHPSHSIRATASRASSSPKTCGRSRPVRWAVCSIRSRRCAASLTNKPLRDKLRSGSSIARVRAHASHPTLLRSARKRSITGRCCARRWRTAWPAGRAEEIARAFHLALVELIVALAARYPNCKVVASGGVFQNALLAGLLAQVFGERLWLNRAVPPNDGGISLGQAALAAAQTTEGP